MGSSSVASLRRAILAAAIALLGTAVPAGAATVLVRAGDGTPDAGGCGSKANPCDTIQAGVDNAVTGDVVSVAKGVYPEDVVISTSGITVRGAGTLSGSPDPACPGDPTRTNFAGFVGTQACRALADQPSCEASWHLAGDAGLTPTASSCFWNGAECRGCGPNNQQDGQCTNTCEAIPPAALHIDANDVTIDKLRVRGPLIGGITVLPGADGAVLRGVRVEGTSAGACIAGLGDGLVVERATVRSCASDCILAVGDDARVERNRVRSCGDQGIETVGQNTRITRNSVRLGFDCIAFGGDGVIAEQNQTSLCDGDGVDGAGSNFTIARNQMRSVGDGVFVECRSFPTTCADATRTNFVGGPGSEACQNLPDQPACELAWLIGGAGAASCFWDGGGCRGCGPNNEDQGACTNTCVGGGDRCDASVVAANRITDAHDDCLDLLANDAGLVVEGNRGAGCADTGVELEGGGIELRRNTISDCATDTFSHGVVALEDSIEHVIEGNSVRGCGGDGFHVAAGAAAVQLLDNVAIDNGGDGFDVEAAIGATIDGGQARNNVQTGVEVSAGADGTAVTGVRASGNLVDFCDAGTSTTQSGNQFGTEGDCVADPEVDD